MTKLAIVIVHYHCEELLAECIRSLQRSTFEDFRVVVVDNGSDRDLSDIELDLRFRLLELDQNQGFAAATNYGIAHLPPEAAFLLSLNPDVVVQPETLGTMLEVFEGNQNLGGATCRLLLPSGLLDPACRRSEPNLWSAFCKQTGLSRLAPKSRLFGAYNLAHLDELSTHPIDACSGAFLMMRRSALDAAGGGFDQRFFLYGEDLDLCRRLREAGYPLLFCPKTAAVHHKGSGRIRAPTSTLHFYRAMWTYYRKWGMGRSNPLVLAALGASLSLLTALELVRNEFQRRLKTRARTVRRNP